MVHSPAPHGQTRAKTRAQTGAVLTPRLADVLHHLTAAENAAAGPGRREAFRLTRAVLGAARANGVPLDQLADCMGVSIGSARGRATRTDLSLSATQVEQLTGQTAAELSHLCDVALEPITGSADYHVNDVVRTLLALPAAGR
jgi:hypothetical protein